MTVELTTFGFKCGAPDGFDAVFDVRDLPNPFYEPHLKPLNGCDAAIAAYFAERPEVEARVEANVDAVLSAAAAAPRDPLRVGIGCTGGQHRSVYVAERMAQRLRAAGVAVAVSHRELAVS